MPLKKPNELPKIPKTRKKKAEAALEAIPEKKPDKVEYYCNTYFKWDRVNKKQLYGISVETAVEFTNFIYELSIEVIKKRKKIFIVLMGLQARMNRAPQVQPAVREIYFEDFIGEYTVNVVKQDGSINSAIFKYNIYKKEILKIKDFLPEKENNRLFCLFDVAEDRFSFRES